MNFLETVVAEWYEYTGYFVRTNPRTRKRSKGGWDVELDVLAYSPKDQKLIHIETSGDSASWAKRRKRFLEKKFILSHQEYQNLVGFDLRDVERVAVVGWTKTTKMDLNWGDKIKVVLIPTLMQEITSTLVKTDPMKCAVPESFPLLRAMQMALAFQADKQATSDPMSSGHGRPM